MGLPGTVPPEEPVKEARGKAWWVIAAERNLRSVEDRAERARPGAKTWLCCSGQGKERMVKNPFLETLLGHAVRLVGSQVPDEGLNPGHDGQDAKAEPPGHQGSPWRHTCFKRCDPLCSALSLDSECLGQAGAQRGSGCSSALPARLRALPRPPGLESEVASPVGRHPVLVPRAFTTCSHQRGDLKQQKCIVSQFWRPEAQTCISGQKVRSWQGHSPVEESRGQTSLPGLLTLQGLTLSSWLHLRHGLHGTLSSFLFLTQTPAAGADTALIQDDLVSRAFFFAYFIKTLLAAPRGLHDLSSPSRD